jgi:hypothetical protein
MSSKTTGRKRISTVGRFTSAEVAGIKTVRDIYPNKSQRGLAAFLYNNRYTYNINPSRTVASIYAAVRQFDKGTLVG